MRSQVDIKHGNRKLLQAEVRFIREMVELGEMTRKELAKKFRMSPESIARVCRGDTYPEEFENRESKLPEAEKRLGEEVEAELAAGAKRLLGIQKENEDRKGKLGRILGFGQRTAEEVRADTRTAGEIAEDAAAFADRADAVVIASLPEAPGLLEYGK